MLQSAGEPRLVWCLDRWFVAGGNTAPTAAPLMPRSPPQLSLDCSYSVLSGKRYSVNTELRIRRLIEVSDEGRGAA